MNTKRMTDGADEAGRPAGFGPSSIQRAETRLGPLWRRILLAAMLCAAARLQAQTNFEQLLFFGLPRLANTPGFGPAFDTETSGSPLALSPQGEVLCGVCSAVDANGAFGDVYSLAADGSGERVLARVPDQVLVNTDCGYAWYNSGLAFGPDGALYGVTCSFDSSFTGQVFKVMPDGTGFQTLHTFGPDARPDGQITISADGTIFGVSRSACGAPGSADFIYRLSTNGSGYTIIYPLPPAQDQNGAGGLQGFLLIGADGALYGTTLTGGLGYGTVFRLSADGSSFTNIHVFTQDVIKFLYSPSRGRLAQGPDGMLYGTTEGEGGGSFFGDIYRVNTNGTGYTNIYTFNSGGTSPQGVVFGTDGALYGAAKGAGITNVNYTLGSGAVVTNTSGFGFVYKINTDGTGFTNLHTFTGLDGRNPVEPLIAGPKGDLYGVTANGGVFDQGTVFKLSIAPASPTNIFYFVITQVASRPQVQVSFSGASSQQWNLQATTNLPDSASWQTVANTDGNGLLNFVDTPPDSSAVRYYRMMHP
jgi:uncharacterized repeat protein (TIGR03803 family)